MALSELQQVNAIIGLSKNLPGWPSILADHQYSLDRIELKFKVRDHKTPGHSIIVNPDLLFVSDKRNASLIVELKSGSFHEHDLSQMDNLIALKPLELIRDGAVTLQRASPTNISSHKISVLMIVNREHLAGFVIEFTSVTYKGSLVAIDTKLIQSELGDLKDNRLDREFKKGINIEKSFMPTRFVRVLPTTNETDDVIKHVVETFKVLWVNNERFVTPQRIATKLFDDIWATFDSDAQRQFINIANKTLKDMRQTDFNRYLEPVVGKSDEWKLLMLPETEGKNRTSAQKRFSRITQEYKWRIQHGNEYKGGRYIDHPTFEDVASGFFPDKNEDEET